MALAVPAVREDLAKFESLAVMPGETIKELKLRLKQSGWYSSTAPSTIVFGKRCYHRHAASDAVRGASKKRCCAYMRLLLDK